MLNQIEQQFNFKYPALYHTLFKDGMLDSGKTGPGWLSEDFRD